MKKNTLSSYLISILPIMLASFLLVGFLTFVKSASPAFAFAGGYALEFDGETDNTDIAPTSDILGTDWQTTKTVSIWVKPLATAPVVMDVVDGDLIVGDNPRWFGIYQANFNNNDRIYVINVDGTSGDGSPFYRILPIEYNVGEWVHIALTHGNGMLKAYKNGVEVGSGTSGTTATGHPGAIGGIDLRFGGSISAESGGYDGTFYGQIDEVRIYSTTLTADQIREDMYRTIAPSTPYLAAYYKMSDGSGITVTDDSGNGHDAILLDGGSLGGGNEIAPDGDTATWIASGAYAGPRNTLDFDGSDDYVNLGTTSNAMIGSGWDATKSVSVWIKPTGTSPSVSDAASGDWVFGVHDGSNARWGISRATIGGLDRIWVWNDDGSEDRMGIDYNADEWIQVTLVHDGGTTLRAYKNGFEIGSTPSGTTSGDGALTIGGLSSTQYFQGQVDEVRVWDTARTETQIRNDGFHTLAHDESGLVAYYRFDQDDDSTHTNLYNIVTNNFTGTLTNMDPGIDWETSAAFNTWIGSDSSNWAAGGNWSRYAAPVISDNVGIYNYIASNQPVITNTVAISNIVVTTGGVLSIGDDGILSVGNGDTLTINTGANLTANGTGIFEIIGNGNGVIVNGTVTNNGTFQHIQNVNNESKAFLHLEDEDGTTIKYRGAAITTTNNLGTVTTTVRTVDRSSSFCTSDGVTSPLYANRCFEINAENSAAATLRLWALTSEIDSGITTPSVYRYTGSGGIWTELTTNADNGTLGAYTYAESDTPGFSHFLIAQSGSAPTAVSLKSFSGASAGSALIPVFGAVLLVGLGINVLRKRRSQ